MHRMPVKRIPGRFSSALVALPQIHAGMPFDAAARGGPEHVLADKEECVSPGAGHAGIDNFPGQERMAGIRRRGQQHIAVFGPLAFVDGHGKTKFVIGQRLDRKSDEAAPAAKHAVATA